MYLKNEETVNLPHLADTNVPIDTSITTSALK